MKEKEIEEFNLLGRYTECSERGTCSLDFNNKGITKLINLSEIKRKVLQDYPRCFVAGKIYGEVVGLGFSNNKIKYLPTSWAKVKRDIHDPITNLSTLRRLDFSKNEIKYLPKSWAKLGFGSLVSFDVSHNLIERIPNEWCKILYKHESYDDSEIDFSNNKIKFMGKNWWKTHTNDFFHKKSTLRLNNNEIKKLYCEGDSELIDELYIQHNKIKKMPKIKALKKFEISFNFIHHI